MKCVRSCNQQPLKQKKVFALKRSLIPRGFIYSSNMADSILFTPPTWRTWRHENILYRIWCKHKWWLHAIVRGYMYTRLVHMYPRTIAWSHHLCLHQILLFCSSCCIVNYCHNLIQNNRPFYSCGWVTWLMAGSKAASDLALIQTSLLFLWKCWLVSITTTRFTR